MHLYAYCCPSTLNNCYLIGSDTTKEAVIVDPGYLDETLLALIEDNQYRLKGILITHDHTKLHGVPSLKRIYDMPVYAVNPEVYGCKTLVLHDRDSITIGPFGFNVLLIPGHTQDSAVFKLGHILFTGDALSAGLLGATSSAYGATTQMNALQSKIFSLVENCILFPCHGPPSSLESERLFNRGIQRYEQNKNRSQLFENFFLNDSVTADTFNTAQSSYSSNSPQ